MRNAARSGAFAVVRATTRRHASRDAREAFRTRSVLPPSQQPTISSEDGSRTLRVRQHAHKPLPLPPLMDPVATRAKERHKQPKPAVNARCMTEFQKKLAENPYAQALALHVRHCNLTGARVPVHFLQPFTGAFTPSPTDPDRIDATIVLKPDVKPPQQMRDKSSSGAKTTYTSSSSYILNNASILEHLNTKRKWAMIVTERMSKAYDNVAAGRKAASSNKWAKQWERDPDMPNIVLEKLRADALHEIGSIVEDGRGNDANYFVPTRKLLHPPAESSRTIASAVIPVYNLSELFPAGQYNSVLLDIEGSAEGDVRMAVRMHARTVKLHMALQKLGAYMGKRQSELSVAETEES